VAILGEGSETEQSAEMLCRNALDRYPDAIFLPIGAAGLFINVLSKLLGQSTAQVLLRHLEKLERDSIPMLMAQAAALWKLGVPVKGGALYEGEQRQRVPLPAYPFQGDYHWFTPATQRDHQPAANLAQADALARFVTQSKALPTM